MEPAVASAGVLAFLTEMFAPLLLCSSIPLGSPPVQDPSLGRIAPEECSLYIGWAGIGVPDANSKNRAEQFLADPEIRHMRAEAARRFRLLCKSKPDLLNFGLLGLNDVPSSIADDFTIWSELFVTQPCALFLHYSAIDDKPDELHADGGLVMNIGESQKQVAAMLDRYKTMAAGTIEETSVDGNAEFHIRGDTDWRLRWALRGQHFIVTWGKETPSQIAHRMNGDEPKWFAAVAKDLPVGRRAALVRIDCESFLRLFADETSLELAKEVWFLKHIRSCTLVTGLDREDFVSRVLIKADKETAATWSQMIARPVALDDLAVVPRDATLALAVNIEPSRLMSCLAYLQDKAEASEKTSQADADKNSESTSQMLMSVASGSLSPSDLASRCLKTPSLAFDKELGDELTASLGDTWRLYTSPGEGSLAFLNITGVVRVKDRDRLAKAFEKMAARRPARKANEKTAQKNEKKDGESNKGENTDASTPSELVVQKSRFNQHDVFLFHRSRSSVFNLVACCIVGDELVCSPSPQNIKAYLLREAGRPSLAEEPAVKETLGSKQPPSLICYEDSREMFRLTYPLMQCCVGALTASAGLQADGPDPMLLPAAPTVAKYLRPAVSTVSMTSKGMEITMHQSLPNGNLGSLFYLAVCSSLPENPNAWGDSNETSMNPTATSEDSETKRPPVIFATLTEKEGPCIIKKREADKGEVVVEVGQNIKGACRFRRTDFFGKTIIDACIAIENISKERRACQYYVAFFDKNGKLIGCEGQGSGDDGLAPAEKTQLGSCLIFLPDEQIEKIASYKVRFYETDKLPEPKK